VLGNEYHLALGDWRLVRITLWERKMYESLPVTLFRRRRAIALFANNVNHDLLLSTIDHRAKYFIFRLHTCNGASDNILDHCRSRSSAPTTPGIPSQLEVPSRKRRLTRQSCPYWISSLVDEHTSIVVEPDQAAIFSLYLLLCSHHHRMPNVSSSHFVRDAQSR
jgi:hypothetical protein